MTLQSFTAIHLYRLVCILVSAVSTWLSVALLGRVWGMDGRRYGDVQAFIGALGRP